MEGNDVSKGKSKKLIAIVLVCIIIVSALVLIVVTRPPPFNGEPEPSYFLRLNYNVGEKLVYRMEIAGITGDETYTTELTYEMEILNFDGENYTIQQTITDEATGASVIGQAKINQTGYVLEYGYDQESFLGITTFFSVPTFRAYFTAEEVKLGDTWKNVLGIETMEHFPLDYSGTGTFTLSEVSDETVTLNYEAWMQTTTYNVNQSVTINGTIHLDAFTYRVVEFNLTESIKSEVAGTIKETEATTHCWLCLNEKHE